MTGFLKKRSKKLGLPPGTLIHVGEQKTEKVSAQLIDYNSTQIDQNEITAFTRCRPPDKPDMIRWITIFGLHDTTAIQTIGTNFNIHPLVLEDIANTGQRPKCEDYDDYIFIVLKVPRYEEKSGLIETEQISLVITRNCVLCFQETTPNTLSSIENRIKEGKGRIRNLGADCLAHSIIDNIVDLYFLALEKMGETIESLETGLISDPQPHKLQALYTLKRNVATIRKSLWPVREAVTKLEKSDSRLLTSEIRPYFRDVYDHTVQAIEVTEMIRDMASGMVDIYLSSVSNRMNAVMKVLTIIATIFIPLTFIAGIYGMNFKYMPELEWKYSYFLVLGVMAAVGGVMVIYFKRKNWL